MPTNNNQPQVRYLQTSSGDIPQVYVEIMEPTEVPELAVGVEILRWTPDGATQAKTNPDYFRVEELNTQRAKNIVVMGGIANNRWSQLRQLSRGIQNGPYHLDGRDGKLTIHNEQISRPISAIYTFMGGNGELLEFHVESNFVKSAVEMSQNSDIDGDTKDVTTTTVQGIPSPDSGNPDAYYIWDRADKAPKQDDITPLSGPRVPGAPYALPNSLVYPKIMTDTTSSSDTTPDTYASQYKVYSSESEAISDISRFPGITTQDYQEYLDNLHKKWNAHKNGTIESVEDLETVFNGLLELEPYIIKRKVRISHRNVDPVAFVQNNMGVTLNPTYHPWAGGPSEGDYWVSAYAHLRSDPNIKILGSYNYYNGDRTVSLIEEAEVEVNIDGIRMLAEMPDINGVQMMSNDITENITNQVKAKAKVIGRPSLESSMNLEINNVSQKFSGAWYTKKAIHRINTNEGYTTELEFIQRDTIISTITHTRKVSTQRCSADLQAKAREISREGYKWSEDSLRSTLKEWAQAKYPDKSVLIVQDEGQPSQFKVYTSDQDFSVDILDGRLPEDAKADTIVSVEGGQFTEIP